MTAEARHGRAIVRDNFTVERGVPNEHGYRSITSQYNEDTSVTRGIMFGQLEAEGDEDTFLAVFENCDDDKTYMTFTLNGFGPDVDLHTARGAPSEDQSWWNNATGNETESSVDRSTSSDTATYTVIAAHDDANVTETGYELRYTTECRDTGGGGWEEDDNEQDLLPYAN